MQVTFRNLLKAYSGQCDGLVYYYNSRIDKLVCRKYVVPKGTVQNELISLKSKNLSALNPSAEYKQDLDHYGILASSKGEYLNWRNVFLRLMYAMEKANPTQVDLCSLTKDEIYALGLPCISVAKAIEAGLLDRVKGYERLTAGI